MKKHLLTTSLLSAMIANTAIAAPADGPYVSLGLSMGQIDIGNIQSPLGGLDINQESDIYNGSLALGYLFNVSDKFSIGPEIGYSTFLNSPETTWDSNGSTVATAKVKDSYTMPIMAVAQYQLSDDVFLFGKAGMAYVEQKVDFSNSEGLDNNSVKNKDWNFAAGFGAGYMINSNLAVSVEYQYIDGDKLTVAPSGESTQINDSTIQTQTVGINLSYLF